MAYDKGSRQVILFGVHANSSAPQTWAWTAQKGWKQLSPSHSPAGRTWGNAAYDDATGAIVLFGGQSATPDANGGLKALADTWTWDGNDWIQLNPATSPPETVNMSLAYDPSVGGLIGVRDNVPASSTETWKWDGTTWSQLHPAQEPPYPKMGAGIAYARSAGATVLFGSVYYIIDVGRSPDPTTWIYSSSSWVASPAAAGAPQALMFPAMSRDPSGGVVMFGGSRGFNSSADTWTWNGTWTKLTTTSGPLARDMGLMAYDPLCNLVLLYGGEEPISQNSLTVYHDSWVWDGQAWAQVG
jgi:hypothetical protein